MTTTTTTPQVSPIRQIESLYARLEKARTITAAGKVHPIIGMTDHYTVESSKGDGFYLVNGVCTCPDAQNRPEVHHGWCCHKLSVELYIEQQAQAETHQTDKLKAKKAESPQDEELQQKVEDLYR